ncbi:Leucyl/phenylalanyl-tRNA--protein transferase [Diplonema papillatum]|nr:Leucyl/phenylalanyl-tRNA--protein transferase [Diplonema papillatum]
MGLRDEGWTLVTLHGEWRDRPELVTEPCSVKKSQKAVDLFVKKLLSGGYHASLEFGYSNLFDPTLIDACCVRGIFPMASLRHGTFAFAPKLHVKRMLVDLATFKPSRSAAKFARKHRYTVSLNSQLPDVLACIAHVHGDNWMCPPLRKAFAHMAANPSSYTAKIACICVWDGENRLAASEAGYIVADVFTSLTGTTLVSGAGSVQLATLGALLQQNGFSTWDLGMGSRYKEGLGGRTVSRADWLMLVASRSALAASADLLLPGGCQQCSCASVLRRGEPTSLSLGSTDGPGGGGRATTVVQKRVQSAERRSVSLRQPAENASEMRHRHSAPILPRNGGRMELG